MNLHRLDLLSQSLVSLVARTDGINRSAELAHLGGGCGCKRISDREGTVGAELFERSINLHAVPVQLGDVDHQRHREHAHDRAVATSSPT